MAHFRMGDLWCVVTSSNPGSVGENDSILTSRKEAEVDAEEYNRTNMHGRSDYVARSLSSVIGEAISEAIHNAGYED